MRRKLKLLLKIFLVIIVTCSCIVLGLYSRYNSGIVITQFESQMGYMLQTKENKIIMIDGGNTDNSEYLEQEIINKGGIVEAWFVTIADKDYVGALEEILKSKKVQINNIYVSFNSEDWYSSYDESAPIEFFDLLDSEEVRDKVHEVVLKQELTIDNLYCKILKVKNSEYTTKNNQNVVLRVSNNFENIIFLPELSSAVQEEVFENNLDEFEADGVQVINYGQSFNTLEVKKDYVVDGNKHTIKIY